MDDCHYSKKKVRIPRDLRICFYYLNDFFAPIYTICQLENTFSVNLNFAALCKIDWRKKIVKEYCKSVSGRGGGQSIRGQVLLLHLLRIFVISVAHE